LSEELDLRDAIKGFVRGLDPTRRNLFLMRYFYMASIKDISAEMDMSEGTVKSHLHRVRNELRNYLTERGIEI
jgi:RNA polymerase sigma-70 factor (ECF subfamily)